MPNYKESKIYKVYNIINDDIYIGSTTQPLNRRISEHRGNCKKQKHKTSKMYQLMNELGVDNFYIELIEDYPCNYLTGAIEERG